MLMGVPLLLFIRKVWLLWCEKSRRGRELDKKVGGALLRGRGPERESLVHSFHHLKNLAGAGERGGGELVGESPIVSLNRKGPSRSRHSPRRRNIVGKRVGFVVVGVFAPVIDEHCAQKEKGKY